MAIREPTNKRVEIPDWIDRILQNDIFVGKRCVVRNHFECDWHHSDGNPLNSRDIANLLPLENGLNRMLVLPKNQGEFYSLPGILEPLAPQGLLRRAQEHFWRGDVRLAYGCAKLATRISNCYQKIAEPNEIVENVCATSYYLRRFTGRIAHVYIPDSKMVVNVEDLLLEDLITKDLSILTDGNKQLRTLLRLLLLQELASWLNERGQPEIASEMFGRMHQITNRLDDYFSTVQLSTLRRQCANSLIHQQGNLTDVKALVVAPFAGANLSLQHWLPAGEMQADIHHVQGAFQKGYELLEQSHHILQQYIYSYSSSGMTPVSFTGDMLYYYLATLVVAPKRKSLLGDLRTGLESITPNNIIRMGGFPGFRSLLTEANRKSNGVPLLLDNHDQLYALKSYEKVQLYTLTPPLPEYLVKAICRLASRI